MKIIKWVIDSHIWIGLGSVGLAIFTLRTINKEIDLDLLSFLFTSTFFIYNFQSLIKWKGRKALSANRSLVRLKELKWITLLSFLALIPISYTLDLDEISFLVIFGLISVFYATKLNWTKKKKTDLRSIPFIKIYLIALVWVGVSVAFPMYYSDHDLGNNEFLFSAMFFTYFIGITIPFDIRDIKYDSPKMKTIPNIFGIQTSKLIAVILLLISIGSAIYLYISAFLAFESMILAVSIFVTSLLLSYFSDGNKPSHYFSGFIDGTIVLFVLSLFF